MPDDQDTSIYNLLINSDPEEGARIVELLNSLTGAGLEFGQSLSSILKGAQSTTDALENMGKASSGGVDKSSESVKELATQLSAATNQANALKEAMAAPSTLPEQSYINQLAYSQFNLESPTAALTGAGGASQADFVASLRQGFRPTFEEPPMMEGEGISTGSMFGVGHALSVAGFMTGAPGLREAGALVYIEEGLRRVTPLFEQLNQTITATPSVLSPVIAGLSGLGVPMAGLLAVAVPLTVALGAIAVAWTVFDNSLKSGEQALKAALNAQMSYYQAVETMTTEEARQHTKDLEARVAGDKAAFAETQTAIEKLQNQTNINMEMGKKLPGKIGDPFRDLSAQFDVNTEAIAKDEAELKRFTGGLESNAFAANDAAEALKKKWAAQEKAALDHGDKIYQAAMDDYANQEMIAKGSVDSAKSKRADLQAQLTASSDAWAALAKDPNAPYSADIQAKLKTYSDNAADLTRRIKELDESTIPAAQAVKDAADAQKQLEDTMKAATKAVDDHAKQMQSAADQITNQSETARMREQQNEQQYFAGSIQDSYQRSQILLDESRKETQLTQDTANSIVDIRTKLSQKESDVTTEYNRKVMDDVTKYQEDKQKTELDTYRKERDNLQSHYDKLADIQNKEAANQQDALLNRNFLQLAQQKDNRQKEIDAENLSYDRRQRDAQTHLQDQEYDLKVHLAEERTQQFVEYQRKLVDDRLQTQREIDQKEVDEQRKRQVLQQSEVQQLNDLTTAETYKLQLLRQGLTQELQMYEMQNQQRLAILDRDYRASQTQALATIQSSATAAGTPLSASANIALAHKLGLMDSGGPFEAGVPFMKGDISELFNFGGGKSYAIPGAAVVMPLQGGTATPQGSNQFNFSIPVNVKSGEDAALEASRQVYQKLHELLGEA